MTAASNEVELREKWHAWTYFHSKRADAKKRQHQVVAAADMYAASNLCMGFALWREFADKSRETRRREREVLFHSRQAQALVEWSQSSKVFQRLTFGAWHDHLITHKEEMRKTRRRAKVVRRLAQEAGTMSSLLFSTWVTHLAAHKALMEARARKRVQVTANLEKEARGIERMGFKAWRAFLALRGHL